MPTRTWTITADSGHGASGYLPEWAADDPSENVPLAQFGIRLSDLTHFADFNGQTVAQVRSPGAAPGEPGRVGDEVLLSPSIMCHPYAEEPERRMPFATVSIIDDYFVDCLDPAALTDFIAALETQVSRLRHEVLPALTSARADWLAHTALVGATLFSAGAPMAQHESVR
jgi:hypothetical protein